MMTERRRGLVLGLTGGVASGKTTVARFFADLGARVVDADALARQVVERGRVAYREIVKTFGRDVLLPDRQINRRELGARVFADPALREKLNAITHPRIRRVARRAINAHLRDGAFLVLYEAALLVETGYYRELDGLIVVSVPEALQLERLERRDGLDRRTARRRLRSQLPLAQKLAVADHVIDTSGPMAATRRQVRALFRALEEAAQRG
jgi:dephospho-CoA kinase